MYISTFTLKQQLQDHVYGSVCCDRVSGVSMRGVTSVGGEDYSVTYMLTIR